MIDPSPYRPCKLRIATTSKTKSTSRLTLSAARDSARRGGNDHVGDDIRLDVPTPTRGSGYNQLCRTWEVSLLFPFPKYWARGIVVLIINFVFSTFTLVASTGFFPFTVLWVVYYIILCFLRHYFTAHPTTATLFSVVTRVSRRFLQNSTGLAGLDGSCRTRQVLPYHHPFGRYGASYLLSSVENVLFKIIMLFVLRHVPPSGERIRSMFY